MLHSTSQEEELDNSKFAALYLTNAYSNRGGGFAEQYIEKDLQSSTQQEKFIEECEVLVFEKDSCSQSLENNHNTSNDSEPDDTTSSFTQSKREKVEIPLMPENLLLKHLNNTCMK